MTAGIMDSNWLDIQCPGCGHKFARTWGSLRGNPTLNCPGCGESIAIEGNLDEALSECEAALKKLTELLPKK
jgi:ribosomal protein S27E